MRRTFSRTLPVLLALATLAGCDRPFWPEPPPVLSKEAVATRDAPPELVFRGTLAGEPVFLLAHNCEVFSVKPLAGQEVEWTSVVKLDPYPFFTGCVRQSLTMEKGVLTADLGRQAFGAGGCCASSGTYRSVDGRNWKKQ